MIPSAILEPVRRLHLPAYLGELPARCFGNDVLRNELTDQARHARFGRLLHQHEREDRDRIRIRAEVEQHCPLVLIVQRETLQRREQQHRQPRDGDEQQRTAPGGKIGICQESHSTLHAIERTQPIERHRHRSTVHRLPFREPFATHASGTRFSSYRSCR